MTRRIARALATGALGVVVALLFLLLRPTGAPVDVVEFVDGARVPPSSADGVFAPSDASTASRRLQTQLTGAAVDPGAEPPVASDVGAAQPGGPTSAGLDPGAPASNRATARQSSRPDGSEGGDSDASPERPEHWCFLKTHDDHDYLSDASAVWNGSRSVWVGKANDLAAAAGYFSLDVLWQGVDATAFRGLRIEVSARVKGMGYFQFFVRMATAADSEIVLTDRQLPSVPTTNRYVPLFPPNGTDWTRLSIVADVPLETDIVYYGIALMNGRAIWIDDVRIGSVDPQLPLTQEPSAGGRVFLPVDARAALRAPTNLDFEATTFAGGGC